MKKLDVVRDGLKVYAELYLPEGSQDSWPIVIFSHGFTAYGGSQEHFAKVFNDAGLGLCLIDFCGGGWKSRSEGSSLDMSVMTEVADLKAVYQVVRKEKGVDPQSIFLMGNSQGGVVSALFSLEVQESIKGLILNFPAFIIPSSSKATYKDLREVPDSTEIFGFPIGKRYYEDIWDLDIYDRIKSFEKEVLIVHGDQDPVVPLSFSEKALETYPHARLKVIQGAGHGYNKDEDMILLAETFDYIRERLA